MWGGTQAAKRKLSPCEQDGLIMKQKNQEWLLIRLPGGQTISGSA